MVSQLILLSLEKYPSTCQCRDFIQIFTNDTLARKTSRISLNRLAKILTLSEKHRADDDTPTPISNFCYVALGELSARDAGGHCQSRKNTSRREWR